MTFEIKNKKLAYNYDDGISDKQLMRIKNKGEYLKPKFDSRKNFYRKAKVIKEGNKLILRSYKTDVAEIENEKAKVHGIYSQTTLRHIKEFLKQNSFKAENSKQIMKDYGEQKTSE